MLPSIECRIAQEIGVSPAQVGAAVLLLDEGATVPFIARYRKEATGALDDAQLRHLEERLIYLRELEARRGVILSSVEEQGKMTPALKEEILAAETKQSLEDLYLPYRQKRRTKAQIAREAGLEPLALLLLRDSSLLPEEAALPYLNEEAGFADAKAALEGARQILMEKFAEDAALLGELRLYLNEGGRIQSSLIEGKEAEGAKFRDWFDFSEPLSCIPSHRALAIFRGRQEGFLKVGLMLPQQALEPAGKMEPHFCEYRIAGHFGIQDKGRPADAWLMETVRWAWRVKISLHLELELMGALRERAEEEAIRVFSRNLKDLLLAAPAGAKCTLGLDPGIRTGCKVAVVDPTGRLKATATIYPHEPRKDWEGALQTLATLCQEHQVELIAIGNGTASRETDQLVSDLMARYPALKLIKTVVSEAGASVYSASEFASKEFPELDVSLRGAVSIARRLQDPLAELVKIEPKSIGVGQYQHDVSQSRLAKSLDAVVEDCVNAVGVDVNTASIPLLSRVSGLNASLAAHIVAYRDVHGAFGNRLELKKVPRLGEKTFEQSAGFLRIQNGTNPLDASAVHPEAYPVVEQIALDLKKGFRDLMGDRQSIAAIDPARYVDGRFGLLTVQDILKEMEKPGRDPRPEFKTARFVDNVREIKDLTPGMVLEGVVSNVAAFGAFIDIGVHQDGLAHISCLSDRFVKDPRDVVKAGDVVRVKVLEIDAPRKRISLTLRLSDESGRAGVAPEIGAGSRKNGNKGAPSGKNSPRERKTPSKPHMRDFPSGNAMSAAFAKLGEAKRGD